MTATFSDPLIHLCPWFPGQLGQGPPHYNLVREAEDCNLVEGGGTIGVGTVGMAGPTGFGMDCVSGEPQPLPSSGLLWLMSWAATPPQSWQND